MKKKIFPHDLEIARVTSVLKVVTVLNVETIDQY